MKQKTCKWEYPGKILWTKETVDIIRETWHHIDLVGLAEAIKAS